MILDFNKHRPHSPTPGPHVVLDEGWNMTHAYS